MTHWLDNLDDRQRKEVAFARLYAEQIEGDNSISFRLVLIARLAELIDRLHAELPDKTNEVGGK